jgi:hypothetical protein
MKKISFLVFAATLFQCCINGLNYPYEVLKDLKDKTIEITQRKCEVLDTYTLKFKDGKVGRIHAVDKVFEWGRNDPPNRKKITLIFGDRIKNVLDVSMNMSNQAISHLENILFNTATYRFEITYIHDDIKKCRRNYRIPIEFIH